MPNSERGGSSEPANKATRTRADRARRNPGLKAQLAAVRTSSMSRPANKATRIRADRVLRNPHPKDQLVAARTNSMLRRANRAIKMADDLQGPLCAAPAFRKQACNGKRFCLPSNFASFERVALLGSLLG